MRLTRPVVLLLLATLAGVGAYSWMAGHAPGLLAGLAARAGLAPALGVAAPTRTGPPPTLVVTALAEQGDVPIRRRTIGFAEPVAVVALKARLDSQVMEQRIVEGQTVAAGDLLFKLDDRELKAQIARDEAALARDAALLERTRADLARKRDLVGKGAASQQMVDQAISDEGVAAATLKADEVAIGLDRVKLGYTEIRAPIPGRVGAISVTPGNLVKANDSGSLATITQITPIRVTFSLPERDLAAVKDALARGEPPVVRTFASGATRLLATGKVDFLDSAVDMTSGTVTAKAIFDNQSMALWPGQSLDVDIETGRIVGAAIVPTAAVQPGQTGSFMFVVMPDRSVEIRQVEVGLVDGARSAISKGLKPGETVVTDGQMRLFAGAKVREQAQAPASPAPNAGRQMSQN